jgi:hypothetical protein
MATSFGHKFLLEISSAPKITKTALSFQPPYLDQAFKTSLGTKCQHIFAPLCAYINTHCSQYPVNEGCHITVLHPRDTEHAELWTHSFVFDVSENEQIGSS